MGSANWRPRRVNRTASEIEALNLGSGTVVEIYPLPINCSVEIAAFNAVLRQ